MSDTTRNTLFMVLVSAILVCIGWIIVSAHHAMYPTVWPHVATAEQCDAMYHAEWVSRHTPAHRGIVLSIKDASCPW